ncbi:hypothetical protein J2Y41_004257 [Arthrobacter sp. 1088]|uniref:nuclear transport factor 2 family protein n=1 Tax=Arthrobacter sp. 1088 TaxID=2817768 RepID=UPI0028611E51|nr:nuclear transport factor 2 family protein [Arthrobacter sp. 1088]MDR6688662.1 hypothetical protein [Arthrobacter sp. 1088]
MANEVESTGADYAAALSLFANIHTALEQGDSKGLADAFVPQAQAFLSHLGEACGAQNVATLLRQMSFSEKLVRYRLVNHYVAIDGGRASHSAYLLGTVGTPTITGGLHAFLFGGHYVTTSERMASGWRLATIRFQLDWHYGDPDHVPGWTLDSAAGRGTASTLIVSELDAPWRTVPRPDQGKATEQLVAEAYVRYAWGLDQADFGLLASAFADDAKADMVPFGPMTGQREIVGKLKDLRNGQPFMQHAASDFVVDVYGDRATMQIHRIVPFMPTLETLDARVFGARYESSLRLDIDGLWKFEWLQYFPGWINLDEGPAEVNQ